MKRAIPIVIVLMVVAVIGYAVWYFVAGPGNTANEALGGSGTIEAEETLVSSLTSGRIVAAPFKEGDSVKKGKVMYRLDPTLGNDAVKQAQASLDAANAQLDQVRDDDDSTDADIAAAEAQVDQARIALQSAKTTAGYSVIAAPVAGVVTNKVADVGEIAAPGASLAVVSDTKHLTVTIYVPETDVGKIKIGQKGTVTVDSSTKEFPAKVTFIASQAEFTPASVETKDQRVKLVYQVKLSVADSGGVLKPGMPADVTF